MTQQLSKSRSPLTAGTDLAARVPSSLLVFAGVAMFPLYICMDVIASFAYDGYSYTDQTISELSAIGAPTRTLWIAMGVLYQLLAFAFACGVLAVSGGRRRIRIVGWLLVGFAAIGVVWWVAPMHQREVLAADGSTWQDTMHLVLAGANSILFFAMVGVGAFAFGARFRWYSFTTIAAMLVFGTLMNMDVADVADNEPTPWLGIWERIVVEGAMLWQAAFAAVLLSSLRSGTADHASVGD